MASHCEHPVNGEGMCRSSLDYRCKKPVNGEDTNLSSLSYPLESLHWFYQLSHLYGTRIPALNDSSLFQSLRLADDTITTLIGWMNVNRKISKEPFNLRNSMQLLSGSARFATDRMRTTLRQNSLRPRKRNRARKRHSKINVSGDGTTATPGSSFISTSTTCSNGSQQSTSSGYTTANPPMYTTANPPMYTTANPPMYTTANPPMYTTANPTANPPMYTTANPTANPPMYTTANPPMKRKRKRRNKPSSNNTSCGDTATILPSSVISGTTTGILGSEPTTNIQARQCSTSSGCGITPSGSNSPCFSCSRIQNSNATPCVTTTPLVNCEKSSPISATERSSSPTNQTSGSPKGDDETPCEVSNSRSCQTSNTSCCPSFDTLGCEKSRSPPSEGTLACEPSTSNSIRRCKSSRARNRPVICKSRIFSYSKNQKSDTTNSVTTTPLVVNDTPSSLICEPERSGTLINKTPPSPMREEEIPCELSNSLLCETCKNKNCQCSNTQEHETSRSPNWKMTIPGHVPTSRITNIRRVRVHLNRSNFLPSVVGDPHICVDLTGREFCTDIKQSISPPAVISAASRYTVMLSQSSPTNTGEKIHIKDGIIAVLHCRSIASLFVTHEPRVICSNVGDGATPLVSNSPLTPSSDFVLSNNSDCKMENMERSDAETDLHNIIKCIRKCDFISLPYASR